MEKPELIIIVCEGKTEIIYFNILIKRFRLPTYIKVIPDLKKYSPLGQHERLIETAAKERDEYSREFNIPPQKIEAWAVCDRDDYRGSFQKLNNLAGKLDVKLAFSDPQFENFLLQHFSQNKSKSTGKIVEDELSRAIMNQKISPSLYNKTNLTWLDEMIDKKHSVVKMAIKNAEVFSNHTKQPFFTIQKLVDRLFSLISF